MYHTHNTHAHTSHNTRAHTHAHTHTTLGYTHTHTTHGHTRTHTYTHTTHGHTHTHNTWVHTYTHTQGAGCALMERQNKFQEIVCGMVSVLDCPLTVKMRTGVYVKNWIAHKLVPKLRDLGVSMATVRCFNMVLNLLHNLTCVPLACIDPPPPPLLPRPLYFVFPPLHVDTWPLTGTEVHQACRLGVH